MSQRPQLTLTAELERLEQQITLTLQKIDHNFARAHRIITTSILPVVERYSKESEAVWEGSKFWKQFFEASANIVLRNYEEDDLYHGDESHYDETAISAEGGDGRTYAEDTTAVSSPGHYSQDRAPDGEIDFTHGDAQARRTNPNHHHKEVHEDDLLDDSLLESLNITTSGPGVAQSTPKHTRGGSGREGSAGEWAEVESPFEALRSELHTKSYGSPEHHQPLSGFRNLSRFDSSSALHPPSTPRARIGMLEDPDYSSPFRPPPQSTALRKTPGVDPLMHRALDKNWRLLATPKGKPASSKYRTAPAVGMTPRQQLFSHHHPDDRMEDSSPISSPAEPQLQTQIFTTPGRGGLARTPGAKNPTSTPALGKYMYDSDSDDELLMPPGFSPPKTMQFSLPPSKLLATPAREASRKIVHDILQTAGVSVDGDITMSTEGGGSFREGAGEEDDPF